MDWITDGIIGLVALIHIGFAYIEKFRWHRATAMLTDFDRPTTEATRALGGNFAIYNLMVATGLMASFWLGDACDVVQMWVLGSIVVVGCYGGATLKGSMPYVAQAAPAGLALVLLVLS